jgi:hypothetical protein
VNNIFIVVGSLAAIREVPAEFGDSRPVVAFAPENLAAAPEAPAEFGDSRQAVAFAAADTQAPERRNPEKDTDSVGIRSTDT